MGALGDVEEWQYRNPKLKTFAWWYAAFAQDDRARMEDAPPGFVVEGEEAVVNCSTVMDLMDCRQVASCKRKSLDSWAMERDGKRRRVAEQCGDDWGGSLPGLSGREELFRGEEVRRGEELLRGLFDE